MGDLGNAHDNFFRGTFGYTQIAGEFLREYLSSEIQAMIDLENLEPQKDSFVDEQNREGYADLLYKTRICGIDGYLYVLFEHKSSPDYHVALQLLRYMTAIWTKSLSEKDTNSMLKPILPLVVYHGKDNWKASTRFSAMFEHFGLMSDLMKQWIPDYAYVFHNITSEEHTAPEDPVLYAVVSALQCTYETDEKVEERVILTFQKIGAAMREGEVSAYVKEVFGRVIYYLLIIRNLSKEFIEEQTEKYLPDEGREIVMSTAQKLREEGRMEGLAMGLEEVAREGFKNGMKIELLTILTKLPLKRLEELKKEVEGKDRIVH